MLHLFSLSTFDTGVHTDMLYHFSSGASAQMVQLYLEMRGCVGKARQPLPDLDFWRGLKVCVQACQRIRARARLPARTHVSARPPVCPPARLSARTPSRPRGCVVHLTHTDQRGFVASRSVDGLWSHDCRLLSGRV